jgi:hypothetical protein
MVGKEPVQHLGSPWGAKGWSQFCEAKLLLAHAAWIAAEILFCGPGPQKRLERKARFFAQQKMRQYDRKKVDDAVPTRRLDKSAAGHLHIFLLCDRILSPL